MGPPTSIIKDGSEDIRRSATELAERLPGELAPLARLAYNHRWSWLPGGHELFRRVDASASSCASKTPCG